MPISDQTFQVIEAELNAVAPGRFHNLYMEFQDAAEFLLVIVEVPDSLSEQDNEELGDLFVSIISPRIPPRRGDHSWMAIIKQQGNFVHVVNSDLI